MNRLHVADLGGADDPVDFQVAVGGLGRTDAIGLVGQTPDRRPRGRPR